MEFIKGIDNYKVNKSSSITIGKFDALHKGHQLLVENIVKNSGLGVSVAIVFSESPRLTFSESTSTKRFIITKNERKAMLEKMGVDYLLELNFDEKMQKTTPVDFIKLLKNKLNMSYICIGEDFNFGYKGKGDANLLYELKDEYNFTLDVEKKLKYKDKYISSTRIRECISKGELDDANEMLGYSFFTKNVVVTGNRIGRTINYPTINLLPQDDKLLPPKGVYATSTKIGNKEFFGMTNIGVRPTIHEEKKYLSVETHLFDFDEDIYEKEVEVSFLRYLREEIKFSCVDELKQQIRKDEESVREYLHSKYNYVSIN